MLLSELNEGQVAVITKLRGRFIFRRRVMEMGFVVGQELRLERKAPFRGPLEFIILGSRVLLRYSEAELIEVQRGERTIEPSSLHPYSGTFVEERNRISGDTTDREVHVALLGNPISGKTSLFNLLTGSHERVGNYSGVTVAPVTRSIRYRDTVIRITDLPGIYSIGSGENISKIIRDFLYEELPDVILNVVDANNLERNLYLTTDLIDMDVRLVMALNMIDELKKSRDDFKSEAFAHLTGVPVIPVSALQQKGRTEVLDALLQVFRDEHPDQRHIHINYGSGIESAIKHIQHKIRVTENEFLTDRFSSRFLAVGLLSKDVVAESRLGVCGNFEEIMLSANAEIRRVEKDYGSRSEGVIADAKFGFIKGALKETFRPAERKRRQITDRIDAVLLHKFFGLPIFAAIMWLMFAATFKLGVYPMHWIESGVSLLSAWLVSVLGPGILRDLLIDGVVSGVGGVLVFLPNILILYFFIALMEDTGYMSRAVFIMDRLMHRIGLHGKSFIPLVMGFGCNVPAIMATRILENRNERLVTMMMNPFMSCNARLPVYILFISAFFPDYSGTMLFIIYALGVVMAILTALIMKKTFFKKASRPFVMELPPYRLPTGKSILQQMWMRSAQYLKKIGGVILIASVLFWALSYFPNHPDLSRNYALVEKSLSLQYDSLKKQIPLSDTAAAAALTETHLAALRELDLEKRSELKEKSYLGRVGHFIEPVIRPLGFDWRIGISILSGIPAKEIIISSLSILYQVDEDAEGRSASLVDKLKSHQSADNQTDNSHPFTPLVALSFMVFVLMYLPCIGTLTAITRESGSWKWGAFMVVYTFSLAWILSFIIYQGGSLLGY